MLIFEFVSPNLALQLFVLHIIINLSQVVHMVSFYIHEYMLHNCQTSSNHCSTSTSLVLFILMQQSVAIGIGNLAHESIDDSFTSPFY